MIRASGAVLWRADGDRVEVGLVHRPRYDDWSLPKGKLRDGEDAAAGAAREVTEETGFGVVLGRRLGNVEYYVPPGAAKRHGQKVVEYWSARASGGEFADNEEVDELRWLDPRRAAEALSYSWDHSVLERFLALPAATATIALVRHARAGDRAEWHLDDHLRPLSDLGLMQSEVLRRWLPLFGPRRVLSAPRVRCVETVHGLADDLGSSVEEHEQFAEEGYWADPDAAIESLLDVARGGEPAVLCSQGKVIPDLVRSLSARAGLDVAGPDGDVPGRKASTWLLSLHGDRLVAADYYPPPKVS